MNYHLQLAGRRLKDAIDSTPRRLDQTFIHVCWIVSSWALTDVMLYAIVCFLLNLDFIRRLWVADGTLE